MRSFWDRVEKGPGCWEWTGAHLFRPNGRRSYGSVFYKGRPTGTHRVSYELIHGPIPDDLYVLHHCDNQGCVRPDHLYLGTRADNTRDSVARRRTPDGERMWNHKLSEHMVRDIWQRLANGVPTERIGREFDISGRTIRYIRSGQRWRYVTHD